MQVFTERETTEVFFGVTKLFQSKNSQLRRMMYLFIKHLANITREEEVIIVVASLVSEEAQLRLKRSKSGISKILFLKAQDMLEPFGV